MSPGGGGEEHEAAGERDRLREEADRLTPVVTARLERVTERIESAGGDPAGVAVVAVTKTFGPAAVIAAARAGLADVGENYAGELATKATALEDALASRLEELGPDAVRWHFLGEIQRRSVRRIAPWVACWQGLARREEAEEIAKRTSGRVPSAFVEVNVAGDPARPGCTLEHAQDVVTAALGNGLLVRGLMAVAPLGGRDVARDAFERVAALNASLGLSELSIGMSSDLEEAIVAGSTMVRLGTALFGERSAKDARKAARGL